MKEKDLSELSTIAAKWQSLKALIKDKGYKIPGVRKFLYVASFLYIISPLDFIPEAILPLFPLTLIDDVGILAFFVCLPSTKLINTRTSLQSAVSPDKGMEQKKSIVRMTRARPSILIGKTGRRSRSCALQHIELDANPTSMSMVSSDCFLVSSISL